MRRIISIITLVIVISSIFVSQEAFANEEINNLINVRLTKPIEATDRVNIYSEDGFYIYERDKLSREIDYLNQEELYVSLGEKGEILFFDQDDELVYYFDEDDDLLFTSDERVVKVENTQYRDYISFRDIGNKLAVINNVDLENYLCGVVGSEMGSSFETEALKAQAIASRTYTISCNSHTGEIYDLCDTTHCQVYGGVDAESDNINKAVNRTKGMIATYNGNPIEAVYYSNSGGYTANADDVWSKHVPYLVAVEDDYSLSYPKSTWEYSIAIDDISNKFNIGSIVNIEILNTTVPDERVEKIKLTGTEDEKTLTGAEFRTTLGLSNINSTLFTVEKNGQFEKLDEIYVITDRYSNIESLDINDSHVISDKGDISSAKGTNSIITKDGITELGKGDLSSSEGTFVFKGKGNGHGVGMSQYGAQGMAKEGFSYEDILKYYYKDIEIETLD